jgi:hypothetical protein
MTDHGHGSSAEHGSKTAAGPSAPGTPFDAEIDVKRIVEIGAWLAVITVVAGIVGFFIYRGLGGSLDRADPKPSPLPEASIPVEPPAPRLQLVPETDLAALRQANRERLSSWGWVDKGAGIAHMPIDEAIARLAVPESAPAPAPVTTPAPAPEPHAEPAPAHGSGH